MDTINNNNNDSNVANTILIIVLIVVVILIGFFLWNRRETMDDNAGLNVDVNLPIGGDENSTQ